ncbi:MAG: LptF/LptG family permease [Crocinitomicaceae bacterium]|nr:LptF/LptG family permease [Crocinitomicaceae bacterium]
MITIIDRYIIKKFLTTFFFMLGVIMILATVFDLAEKLSNFIEMGASAYEVIFQYYFNFILLYANMFSPMIIFVSVIWFTSKMAQDTEIIPIWNSGRTFGRFVRPYMIAATILMIISLIVNHFIVPQANKVRLDFEEKYYWNQMVVADYHAEFPGNQVVYFANYSSTTDVVNGFTVEQWNEDHELVSFLRAEKAQNIAGTKKWVLTNYFERVVGETEDKVIEASTKDTIFDFTIDEMATRENVAESMTFFEIREFIKREREKGSARVAMYEIVLYERSSLPFSTYILTIIGIAVASRKKRGGVGVNIALGIGIIFIYIFAMKVTAVAAMNVGFASYLAVWVPNAMFGGIAYLLYRNVQR